MKNDSFINYYNYCNVAIPSTNSLDDLISLITSWNTTGQSSTTFDNSLIDPLSRLKVSSPLNIQLKIQNIFDTSPNQIDEITAASAVSSYNAHQNAVNMSVISSDGSRIVRQSKLYPTHTFGSTSFALVNGVLTTNTTNSNMTSKIGMFDDSNDIGSNGVGGNGIFFKYNNTSNMSLVYRTNYGGSQVDYEVPQSNWNIDILGGSGVSGQTLSASQQTNYIFEWNQVNNSNTVRAGILGHGLHYCHVFSNIQPFGNPSLPVRWEIGHDSNLGSANAATLVQGPATVYTDASFGGTYNTFTSSTSSFVNLTTPWCTHPIISVRLQSQYERAKLIPTDFEIINIAPGGVGKWTLVLNSSLSNPDWQSIYNSYAEIDTSSSNVSGGIKLASGFFYDAGVTKTTLSDKDIELLCKINGTQDILTLQVKLINGTLNLGACLTWNEKD